MSFGHNSNLNGVFTIRESIISFLVYLNNLVEVKSFLWGFFDILTTTDGGKSVDRGMFDLSHSERYD
jgi:hypothetical protein